MASHLANEELPMNDSIISKLLGKTRIKLNQQEQQQMRYKKQTASS